MKTIDIQLNQTVSGKAGETVDVEMIPSTQSGQVFKPRRIWAHATCEDGALIGPPRIGGREQRWGRVTHESTTKWLPVVHFDYDNQSGTVAIAFDICGPGESFVIPVKFEKDCTVHISVFGWGGMS